LKTEKKVLLAGGIEMIDGVVAPFKTFMADVAFKDWDKFAEHPIQRDTDTRVSGSMQKQFKNFRDHHLEVFAAVLPSGDVYRLDGNTRTRCINLKLIPEPSVMYVTFRYAGNLSELMYLYTIHDNTFATENVRDKATGAVKFLLGHEPKSSILKKEAGLTSALKIITPKTVPFDIYRDLPPWRRSIQLLESYGVKYNRDKISCGIFAAMLVTLDIFGDDAMVFWSCYMTGEGAKKDNNTRNGIQALIEFTKAAHYKDDRAKNQHKGDIIGVALHCYHLFRFGGIITYQSTKQIPAINWKLYHTTRGIQSGLKKQRPTKKQITDTSKVIVIS
jgi:hypothetical protein